MVPYFAFNLGSGGNLWPNTFYAKQAEYTFLWDQPLPLRFFQLLYFSLGGPPQGLRGISGAHLLLLPVVAVCFIHYLCSGPPATCYSTLGGFR
jgi:hypothetical protein